MSLLNKNAFAALEAKKVKKTSSKSKSSNKDGDKKKTEVKTVKDTAELEKAIFSNPVGLGISSWADDDDEDDFTPVDAGAGNGWSKVGPCVYAPPVYGERGANCSGGVLAGGCGSHPVQCIRE